jgi:predicted GNAT superfamily acetyltransferase
MIRGLQFDDWAWVSALNAANEVETSPLTEERFHYMMSQCLVNWAFGERDAFLLVFDQASDYDSPNFLWFKERYPSFAYVDRIVVSAEARGRGIARTLYQHLFTEVYEAQFDKIVCEVNVEPPNPASDAFHERLGFTEVGRAALANGKAVRYLKRDLP